MQRQRNDQKWSHPVQPSLEIFGFLFNSTSLFHISMNFWAYGQFRQFHSSYKNWWHTYSYAKIRLCFFGFIFMYLSFFFIRANNSYFGSLTIFFRLSLLNRFKTGFPKWIFFFLVNIFLVCSVGFSIFVHREILTVVKNFATNINQI